MNSKYVCISTLIILAILISGVSAADHKLIDNNFGNKAFKINIPSESNFIKEVNTHVNLDDLDIKLEVFKNNGDNSKDLAMILYLKDSSSNKNIISEVIDDLKKEGDIIEENDNYLILKNKNSKEFQLGDFNFEDIFNTITNFIKGFFSDTDSVNLTTDDADVKISNEGINVVDSNDTKVSLSSKGLEVSDKDENVSISSKGLEVSDKDENVSISSKGLEVSSNKSDNEDNDSTDKDISISKDLISYIDDSEYSLCIKNQNNTQVIILLGNNLDLMKSLVHTASFNEN